MFAQTIRNFGRVTDGMDVVDRIDEDDRIIRIELLE